MLNAKTWDSTVELCGFILRTGEVVFVNNKSENPSNSFEISQEDIDLYGLDNIAYFWHSHPSNNLNLSVADYFNFLKYPDHIHRIYTENAFRDYKIRNGLVIQEILS